MSPVSTGTVGFTPLTLATGWQGWDASSTEPRRPRVTSPTAPGPRRSARTTTPPLAVMRTPAMDSVFTALRRLLLNRRRQAGARRGLIIPGPATTGKTTTMMALGRSFQPADARRHPGQDGRRPVLFISVPPAATPKMLVSAFARFLGMPLTDRLNQTQITSAVCDTVCELGTQLVLIDDVHLLDTQRRAGAETSDQLKHLGETHPGHLRVLRDSTSRPPHCSAGCAERRSPADSRSSATAHWRMPPSRTERSGTTSYKAMEDLLRLRAHRPGALVKHAAYLHARTAGRIGSLSHLIREAALVAIVEGAERITKQLLSEAELDAAAEAQARPARPRTTAAEASGVTQQLSTTATGLRPGPARLPRRPGRRGGRPPRPRHHRPPVPPGPAGGRAGAAARRDRTRDVLPASFVLNAPPQAPPERAPCRRDLREVTAMRHVL